MSENVTRHFIFSEEGKHIPYLSLVQRCSLCGSVPTWMNGVAQMSRFDYVVPRTLEPLEETFRNLKYLKCPPLKPFTELA